MQDASQLVAQLVATPSPNSGEPRGEPLTACEGAVAELVADYLTDLGLEVRRQHVVGERANVLCEIAGTGDRRLLLDAHMDTVPAEGMAVEPFSGEVRDGKVFGRGACDDKGTLAAIVLALKDLVENEPPACTVQFSATVDEEVAFRGMRALAAEGLEVDAAIIGEPTNLSIVVATKGALRWRIRTRGTAAHSSAPELGVNAIYGMAEVIRALREQYIPRLAERVHPLLGSPTFSVGTIEGGSQVNIVPEECTIEVDRRTLPGETPEPVLAEVEAVLAGLRAARPDLNVRTEEPDLFFPAVQTPENSEIVAVAREAVRDVVGRAEVGGVPFTSHASVVAPLGIPCVLFGPGDGALAHSATEYVPIEQVEQAARIFAGICRRFGRT
jgi:acetylornithine deacetylase